MAIRESDKIFFQKDINSRLKQCKLTKDAPEYKVVKNFVDGLFDLGAGGCIVFKNKNFYYQLSNMNPDEFVYFLAHQIFAYHQDEESDLTWDEMVAKIQTKIMEIEAEVNDNR